MLTLLVVEDHVLVREGLVRTLARLGDKVRVLEAADATVARACLEREAPIDLVLLDLGLPGVDGFAFLRSVRRRFGAVPVVILSAYDDTHTVSKAMKAGAAGFVSKSYSGEKLLEALRQVLDGKIYLPRSMAPAGISQAPPTLPIGGSAEPAEFGLTDRQAEVLSLMTQGHSNRDIARLLVLSEGTVKIHVTAIFKALDVSSRTQAMVAVARYGIKL